MSSRIVIPRATIDTSRFPVVVVTECGVLHDLERVQLMQDLEDLLDRGTRHAVVLDLTRGAQIPREQRAYVTEVLERRSDLIAEAWAAIALVVRMPLLHQRSAGAFWFRHPVPGRMFLELEDAITWAQGCVALSATGPLPIFPSLSTSAVKRG